MRDAVRGEPVAAQHALGGQVLQIGGRLGAVQTQFLPHHPEREPDGVPGVAPVLGDGGDPVADGAAAQMRLRQDAPDGDLPDHLVTGEHHTRPDRAGPVSRQQAIDPRCLALRGEEVVRLGRFPRPERLGVPHPVGGDRGGVGGLYETDAGAAGHGPVLVRVAEGTGPTYAGASGPVRARQGTFTQSSVRSTARFQPA